MYKQFILLIALNLLFINSFSQAESDFPVLTGDDLPGAKFLTSRTFNGESLYGYIDGGADLYLEYGFREVTVTELTVNKSKYKVEIFRMLDPLAALGIFTVSRFKCGSIPGFARYACHNRYQLQVCRGSYYISIINDSGTPADSVVSVRIGKVLSDKINETDAETYDYLPDVPMNDLLVSSHPYFVKGRLGLFNSQPDLESYFKGLKGYSALILAEKINKLISLKFTTPGQFAEFAGMHNWDVGSFKDEFVKMPEGEYVRKLSDLSVMIIIPETR